MFFSALAVPHVILQRESGWGLDDHAMRAGFHRLVDMLYLTFGVGRSVCLTSESGYAGADHRANFCRLSVENLPKAWFSSDDERWSIAIGRYEGMKTCSYAQNLQWPMAIHEQLAPGQPPRKAPSLQRSNCVSSEALMELAKRNSPPGQGLAPKVN